jgi:hypothetical protein
MLRRSPLSCLAIIALSVAPVRSAHADDDIDALLPATATGLSIGVTVGGAAVIALAFTTESYDLRATSFYLGGAAVVVGPSVGHWYAGEIRPTPAASIRVGGIALGFLGLITYAETCALQGLLAERDCALRDQPVVETMLAVGAGAFLVGAIYDIATARRAVLRENARRASARRASWSVAPMVTPITRGVSLARSF